MNSTYEINGLMFWTEKEIRLREVFRDHFIAEMRLALWDTNPAWNMTVVESPILTPRGRINPNYTGDDIYIADEAHNLVLRPETTPGTYAAACHVFTTSNYSIKPPVCFHQFGKSFRKEQDSPQKHMKLKEFYQLEFQCIFTADSKNDYHAALLEPVRQMIAEAVCLETRVVPSDRLPDYSLKTSDVEAKIDDRWLELASVSLRKDFPIQFRFGDKHKDLLVAEVAIGMDRCVYCRQVNLSSPSDTKETKPCLQQSGVSGKNTPSIPI